MGGVAICVEDFAEPSVTSRRADFQSMSTHPGKSRAKTAWQSLAPEEEFTDRPVRIFFPSNSAQNGPFYCLKQLTDSR